MIRRRMKNTRDVRTVEVKSPAARLRSRTPGTRLVEALPNLLSLHVETGFDAASIRRVPGLLSSTVRTYPWGTNILFMLLRNCTSFFPLCYSHLTHFVRYDNTDAFCSVCVYYIKDFVYSPVPLQFHRSDQIVGSGMIFSAMKPCCPG